MKFIITSPYGAKESFRDKPHTGIDFRMEEGTPLTALKDGVIRLADYGDKNAGKTIFLEMENGKTAIYGHLSDFTVKEGQKVTEGQIIGFSGKTGHVVGQNGGEHLHFAIKENGQFINPSEYEPLIQEMGTDNLNIFEKAWNRVLDNGQVDAYDPVSFFETLINRMVDALGLALKNLIIDTHDAIYAVLPEIGGIVTIAAGLAIMLTGNVPKYLIIYGFTIAGVVAWLYSGIM